MVSSDSGKPAPGAPPASQDTDPPKLLREGEGMERGRDERGEGKGEWEGKEW